MNIRRPNLDCPMNCSLRNSPQCVCNFAVVSDENSPISSADNKAVVPA